MPLTALQQRILACLAEGRTPDSYLAGGAAIHFEPQSQRYSGDLDFFHDSMARVASAFATDQEALLRAGFSVDVEISQPGFLRAHVSRDSESTQIDWAHDSAWRFLPTQREAFGGYVMHPVDLAINKLLALAGRDEPRDFVDILYVHEHVLSLPSLVWAACGKDPGFNPLSLLELLKRRSRYRADDFARLDLATPFDIVAAKQTWLAALDEIDQFARARPIDEVGCLYWSVPRAMFITPALDAVVSNDGDLRLHFGRPGGVLPAPSVSA